MGEDIQDGQTIGSIRQHRRWIAGRAKWFSLDGFLQWIVLFWLEAVNSANVTATPTPIPYSLTLVSLTKTKRKKILEMMNFLRTFLTCEPLLKQDPAMAS